MRRIVTSAAALVLLLLWQSGCAEMPFGPGEAELGDQERIDLAWSLAELAYASGSSQGAQSAAAPGQDRALTGSGYGRDFALAHACPRGGVLRLAGEVWTGTHAETHHTITEFGGHANPDDCGVEARGAAYTLDGNPSLEIGGRFERGEAGPVGLQRVTLKGGFLWSSGERSGACEVQLTAKWDASTGTRYLHGLFCGLELNVQSKPASSS